MPDASRAPPDFPFCSQLNELRRMHSGISGLFYDIYIYSLQPNEQVQYSTVITKGDIFVKKE